MSGLRQGQLEEMGYAVRDWSDSIQDTVRYLTREVEYCRNPSDREKAAQKLAEAVQQQERELPVIDGFRSQVLRDLFFDVNSVGGDTLEYPNAKISYPDIQGSIEDGSSVVVGGVRVSSLELLENKMGVRQVVYIGRLDDGRKVILKKAEAKKDVTTFYDDQLNITIGKKAEQLSSDPNVMQMLEHIESLDEQEAENLIKGLDNRFPGVGRLLNKLIKPESLKKLSRDTTANTRDEYALIRLREANGSKPVKFAPGLIATGKIPKSGEQVVVEEFIDGQRVDGVIYKHLSEAAKHTKDTSEIGRGDYKKIVQELELWKTVVLLEVRDLMNALHGMYVANFTNSDLKPADYKAVVEDTSKLKHMVANWRGVFVDWGSNTAMKDGSRPPIEKYFSMYEKTIKYMLQTVLLRTDMRSRLDDLRGGKDVKASLFGSKKMDIFETYVADMREALETLEQSTKGKNPTDTIKAAIERLNEVAKKMKLNLHIEYPFQ